MGTNYYLRMNICKHCGRYDEYHIGKSSAGWKFIFQAYKFEEGESPSITTINDWKALLFNEHYKIYDQYGEEWDANRFWDKVQAKELDPENRSHVRWYGIDGDDWIDGQGYDFSLRGFS